MTSETGSDAKPKPRASVRLGRRIFVIALVVYTLALCAAAVWSWWPVIFWPTPSADARAAYRDVRCAEGLVELRGRLDAELGRVTAQSTPKEPRFWEDWDDRHAALRDACARDGADPGDAYSSLYRLRYRYAAFAARFEDDAAPLARATDERIERAVDRSNDARAARRDDDTSTTPTRPRLAQPSAGMRADATSTTSPAAAGDTNGQDL